MINSNEQSLIYTFHNMEADPKKYAKEIQVLKESLPDCPLKDYIEAKTSLENMRSEYIKENPGTFSAREKATRQNTFFNEHRAEFERIDALFERIKNHDYGMAYANQKEYCDILRETYFQGGATVAVAMSQDYEGLRERYESLATQDYPVAFIGAAKLSFDLGEQDKSIQQYTQASAQGYKTGQVGIYYLQHILGELANSNPKGPSYFGANHIEEGQKAINDLIEAIDKGDVEAIAFGQRYLDDRDKALKAKDDPNISAEQRQFANIIVKSCDRIEESLLKNGAMIRASSSPEVAINYTDYLITNLKNISTTPNPDRFNFPTGFDLSGTRNDFITALRQNDPIATAKAHEFQQAYQQYAKLDRSNLSEAQTDFLALADQLNSKIQKAFVDNNEKGFLEKNENTTSFIANPDFNAFNYAQHLKYKGILQDLLSEVGQMRDVLQQKSAELAPKSAGSEFNANKYSVTLDASNNLNVLHNNIKNQLENDPNITKQDITKHCDRLNDISNTCQAGIEKHQIKGDLKQRFCDKVKEIVHDIKEKLGLESKAPVYSTVKTAESFKQTSEKAREAATKETKEEVPPPSLKR